MVALRVALHEHGVARVLYFYQTVFAYRMVFINFSSSNVVKAEMGPDLGLQCGRGIS